MTISVEKYINDTRNLVCNKTVSKGELQSGVFLCISTIKYGIIRSTEIVSKGLKIRRLKVKEAGSKKRIWDIRNCCLMGLC